MQTVSEIAKSSFFVHCVAGKRTAVKERERITVLHERGCGGRGVLGRKWVYQTWQLDFGKFASFTGQLYSAKEHLALYCLSTTRAQAVLCITALRAAATEETQPFGTWAFNLHFAACADRQLNCSQGLITSDSSSCGWDEKYNSKSNTSKNGVVRLNYDDVCCCVRRRKPEDLWFGDLWDVVLGNFHTILHESKRGFSREDVVS